jgi:hypothetical protein
MTPAGTLVLLNPEPTFEAIESAGGRVTKHEEAHVLAGFFFVSGIRDPTQCARRAPCGARRTQPRTTSCARSAAASVCSRGASKQASLAHTFAPGNYGPRVVGSLYALRAT